jgi:hypothetical protein
MAHDSAPYVIGAVLMAHLTYFTTFIPEFPIIISIFLWLRTAYMAWNISRA